MIKGHALRFLPARKFFDSLNGTGNKLDGRNHSARWLYLMADILSSSTSGCRWTQMQVYLKWLSLHSHIIVYGEFKVKFEVKVRSLCFFPLLYQDFYQLTWKKVNKLTTPGGKKRLLISSQRLWNGFAHKTPGFFSDLQRPCLSHWAVYHFMGEKKEVLPWKMLCYITVWHYLNIKRRSFYLKNGRQ